MLPLASYHLVVLFVVAMAALVCLLFVFLLVQREIASLALSHARRREVALTPLLMDEPFASLDALTRRKMQEELLGIWEATNKTILFVTHSIPEAVVLGDRILILSPGPGRVIRIMDNPAVGQRETETALEIQREIQAILG